MFEELVFHTEFRDAFACSSWIQLAVSHDGVVRLRVLRIHQLVSVGSVSSEVRGEESEERCRL